MHGHRPVRSVYRTVESRRAVPPSDAGADASQRAGQIAKSLQDQIGAGRGDELTPGSSRYLILRDPARAVRRGRQLFQRKFTLEQGQGPRVSADAAGDIMGTRAFGAGLSDSCAGCHGRPRGSAGAGGVVQTRPDSRDAPHLFGLGLLEQLGDEMTADLREIRAEAIGRSRRGSLVTLPLVAKGVSFGSIRSSCATCSPT